MTLAFTLAFGASSGQAQEYEWQSALETGSPRLALFSLIKQKPAGSWPLVRELLQLNGLRHREGAGPQRLSFRTSIRPIVEYEDNINGGFPNDSFFLSSPLGELEFRFPSEQRAKEGLVYGAGVSASTTYSIGKGSTFTAGAALSHVHSFEHDLNHTVANLSACTKTYQQNWLWLDACAGALYSERDLSTTEEAYVSVGLDKVFSSRFGSHEGTIRLRHGMREEYSKTSVALNLVSALPDIGALSTGINFGEEIEGSNTRVYGANLGLTRPLWDKSMSFGISYAKERGGRFIGQEREDDVYSLSVGREITEWITATVTYRRRESTVDVYDQESFGFGVRFTGWNF